MSWHSSLPMPRGSWCAALAAAALVFCAAVPAHALPGGGKTPRSIVEAQSDLPPVINGVDVQEHLGELLPSQVEFTDASGQTVRLGDVLAKGKPVVLSLVYYSCPQLCNLVINAQVKAMQESGMELGKDFEAVTVSIDPKDTAAQSLERRRRHLQALGKPEVAPWHFLTGSEENIRKLADAVGFKYVYDADTRQYGHPAVVHIITPESSISRYLYGTSFPAKDFRLALLEAAGGRVGTSFDRIILSCFKYDTAQRRYGFYIFGFLRLGALAVFAALSTMLVYFWRRELKKGAAV